MVVKKQVMLKEVSQQGIWKICDIIELEELPDEPKEQTLYFKFWKMVGDRSLEDITCQEFDDLCRQHYLELFDKAFKKWIPSDVLNEQRNAIFGIAIDSYKQGYKDGSK